MFIDSQSCSYRAGREFETDTQYHGWRHNTRQISFETDMNGMTVQVPLSSYFDAHFKNKYSYDKRDYALLYLFFNDGRKVTSALFKFSCRKSFKLSESCTEHTDSPLLLDNVADVELQGPNFCGYNITFERDWYKCDREAAMAVRQFCDSKDKETETTVSRKTLHVPEVSEDDKDLEY